MTVFDFDLVIIGAGAAGMAAAAAASALGLSTALVDEQRQPGGQIYRAIEAVEKDRPQDLPVLGPDYAHGGALARALRGADKLHYLAGQAAWQIERDGGVWCSDGARASRLRARHVLLATGAMERAVPVPGWTLPGVMTAGAAQILLKSSGMVPEGPIALAGGGPLLLLIADQLIQAGASISVLAETTSWRDYVRAARHLPKALRASEYLKKGIAMRRRIRDAGVEIVSGISGLEIAGTQRAAGVAFDVAGRRREIAADTVLLHHGVVPNTQATRQLRLPHEWHGAQHYWYPNTDDFGATEAKAIFVAGDGAGILGARAAELAGRLAVLEIAHRLGRIDAAERDRLAGPLRRDRDRQAAVRPMLDALFPPPAEILNPPKDETIICRCEEVTAGQVRQAADLGVPGPNQLKAFLRAGMGPCQGRLCGLSVTEIIAARQERSPQTVGAYRIRPPLKPLSVAELADMQPEAD